MSIAVLLWHCRQLHTHLALAGTRFIILLLSPLQETQGQALEPTTSWTISIRPEGSAGPRPSSARVHDRDPLPHHPEHDPTHGANIAPTEGFASGPDEGPAGPRPSSASVDDSNLSSPPAAHHDGPAFGPVGGHDEGLVIGLAEGLTDGPAKSPADGLAHGLADSSDHPDPMHDAASPAGSGNSCSLVQLLGLRVMLQP